MRIEKSGIVFVLLFSAVIALLILASTLPEQDKTEKLVRYGGPKNLAMLPLLAESQNYFKHEGLTVKRHDIQTGKMAMDALINNNIDFAVLVETNMAFVKFNPDARLKVIAIIGEKTDDAIIARKDKGIETVKDLEGKKLAVTYATTSHAFAMNYLKDNNVDISKVNIVNMAPPAIQAALISGELDAGSLWQPLRYNVLNTIKDNANEMNDINAYKAYSIVVVREDYAKTHNTEITSFIKALIKAEKYLAENKEQSQEIISKEIDIPIVILKSVWHEYDLKVSMSSDLLEAINKEGTWIINTQPDFNDKQLPDYKILIAEEYLQKIDSKRVTGFR